MDTHARIRPITATVAPAGSATGGDFNQSRASQEAERAARYKLVIEQSARKGVFIYKVLDRETGEVVRQLPREEVARLGSHKGYAPGTVINTSL
ncbi:flagellar protein FlaG [Brevundimonas sp.]|uniref:flagellar protein FlaG n=1 Tax=Brevundimonas sp. TaxID=1871086 RepID=UPI0025C56AAA|nr:flagellar protein FlaG [Brevundimonas sp.]